MPQLSVAPGTATLTTALHWPAALGTVRSLGHTIVGAWLSVTMMRCGQLTLLPWPSSSVQVMRLVPSSSLSPYASLFRSTPLTLAMPQLSVAVGTATLTTALHWPAALATVRTLGNTIAGVPLSVRMMRCGQLTLLPWPSSAVQVMVVVPTG